jgi:hypothetical protein
VSNHRTSGYRKTSEYVYLEKLPRRLRDALNGAAYTYDAKWFYDRWNQGTLSVDKAIKVIREADMEQAIKAVKWRDGFKWRSEKSATAVTRVRPLYT